MTGCAKYISDPEEGKRRVKTQGPSFAIERGDALYAGVNRHLSKPSGYAASVLYTRYSEPLLHRIFQIKYLRQLNQI